MDKQKQINEIADIIFEALNNNGRIANGEGVDIISVAIYNAGYRKIPENAVIIDKNENPCLSCPVPEDIQRNVDCSTICGAVRLGIDWQNQCMVLVKENKQLTKTIAEKCKETAEKFARLVEFHSVSTRDEEGREIFTISALGLKEILHEEFGIPYDKICEEITEGKV